MKLKLMTVAALVACSAVAMPTDDELAKATKEVQASLETQIAAWQEGRISAGDLAALVFRRSRRFKDEARHYACLQMALEMAVRVNDVLLAADILEKIAADTKDFGRKERRTLIRGAFKGADKDKGTAKKADKVDAEMLGNIRFLPYVELELDKRAYMKSVSISDATAYTVALMKLIHVPAFDVKPTTTLAGMVTFLNIGSRKHDLHTPWKGVKIVLKMAKGEPVPAFPEVHAKNVSIYDAVDFIAKATGYTFEVKDDLVIIFKKDGAAKKNQQETK